MELSIKSLEQNAKSESIKDLPFKGYSSLSDVAISEVSNAVTDYWIGVLKKDLEHGFEKFVKTDTSNKNEKAIG